MTGSFRSSGVVLQQVQQADGRHEVIAVQINIVAVTSAEEGSVKAVVKAAAGLFRDHGKTMTNAEIAATLRYLAGQFEQLG